MSRTMQTLGDFLAERRLALELGLRELSERTKIDPSNLSKYERNVGPAPSDDVTKRLARGLEIQVGRGALWKKLAALVEARRCAPADIRQNARAMELMPAFYQHLRDHDLPEGDDPIEVLAKLFNKVV
jgi:transcriptional regulator with XRE-family HTH domain